MTGRDFGDTLTSQLPSILGNTIGNLAAGKIASIGSPKLGYDLAGLDGGDGVTSSGSMGAMTSSGVPMVAKEVSASELLHATALAAENSVATRHLIEAGFTPEAGQGVYSGASVPIISGQAAGTSSNQYTDGYDYRFEGDDIGYYERSDGAGSAHFVALQQARIDVAQNEAVAIQSLTLGPKIALEQMAGGIALNGLFKAAVAAKAAVAVGRASSVSGISTAEGVLYNGITGPGPLGAKVANTFRSGSYTEVVTSDTTTLYRVYGGRAGEIGPYWTRTPPSGPVQSVGVFGGRTNAA